MASSWYAVWLDKNVSGNGVTSPKSGVVTAWSAFYVKCGTTVEQYSTNMSDTIYAITPATAPCWAFDGYKVTSATMMSSFWLGKTFVGSSGILNYAAGSTNPACGEVQLRSQWTRKSYRVNFTGLGTSHPSALYNGVNGGMYTDDQATTSAGSSITPPTRDGYIFAGYFTSSSGGDQYIDESGNWVGGTENIKFGETNLPTYDGSTGNGVVRLWARWRESTYTITLNDSNGSGGSGAVYIRSQSGGVYVDAAGSLACASVLVPTRNGYTFSGYFTAASGGTKIIDADGTFVSDPTQITASASGTWYAQWAANTYTLRFDANGGTASSSSKTVTFGSAIGTLPTCSQTGMRFGNWRIDGSPISSSTVWNIAGDGLAVAYWEGLWGEVTDYFGLSTGNNAKVMCISSDDGGSLSANETSHTGALALQAGDSAVGAYQAGGKLLNPRCTYRIKSAGSIGFTLGNKYGNASSGVSGYFLTSATYSTGADQEPTLTLQGTANEGANAINTYAVSLNVDPDHIAQDPKSAINGGGELVECTTTFTCDPVVVYEGDMPCASDVVHGRKRVEARTCAYKGENAPTAKTGYVSKGVQTATEDVDFTVYAITAEGGL